MKILPLGAELFHADGRATDMMQLVVVFRKFANASKNGTFMIIMELMPDQFITAFN
jgi:hypothetical protein